MFPRDLGQCEEVIARLSAGALPSVVPERRRPGQDFVQEKKKTRVFKTQNSVRPDESMEDSCPPLRGTAATEGCDRRLLAIASRSSGVSLGQSSGRRILFTALVVLPNLTTFGQFSGLACGVFFRDAHRRKLTRGRIHFRGGQLLNLSLTVHERTGVV